MTTIRRTYAYLLAFAGLALLAVAAANLGQLLIDVLLHAALITSEGYVRDTASAYGAAALVGLPVWLLHWRWIEHSARTDQHERASTLRRLELYVVMAIAASIALGSVSDVLRHAFEGLIGGSEHPSLDEILRPLPFTLIALLVWRAHWRIAEGDRQQVGETGGSATLRRWYVFGAAFVGWLTLVTNLQSMLAELWRLASGAGVTTAPLIAAPASATLVGLGLWLLHWVVLPARLPLAARQDDGTAVLPSLYLFVALAASVSGALVGASQLLFYALGRLLGVSQPGGVGGNLLQAAAGPASTALVFGAAWAYQRAAVRRRSAQYPEAPRQAGVRRLYAYVVALLALAVWASGAAGLVWTLGDALTGVAASNPERLRELLALFTTLTVVGLPVWLLHWRARPAQVDETQSLARRLYVYLTLIAATLSLVGSTALALYRVLGLALGESFSAQILNDLAHGLAVAVVAALIAVYHWRILRADAQRPQLTRTAPDGAQSTDDARPRETMVEALVEIRAADTARLDRAISSLQAAGVHVTVRERLPATSAEPSGAGRSDEPGLPQISAPGR